MPKVRNLQREAVGLTAFPMPSTGERTLLCAANLESVAAIAEDAPHGAETLFVGPLPWEPTYQVNPTLTSGRCITQKPLLGSCTTGAGAGATPVVTRGANAPPTPLGVPVELLTAPVAMATTPA